MPLLSDGAPAITGASSTPGTPTSVADLASILYGTKGTSTPVPNSSTDLFNTLYGPASGHTPAGTILGADGKPTYNVEGVKPLTPPPSQPVKTVPIGTLPQSGGSGSGLASPSSLAQLAAMASGGGAPSVDANKQATDLVTAQFQPLLDELNRQLQQDQTVYGQQSAQVKADQARLDSNTQAIYSLLHNQLGELQGQSDQEYDHTGQQVGGSFDQLMSRLGEIFGGAGNQLQGDLNQLNLPAGTADNFGNHSLVDNYSLLRGLADTDKTSTMGNLATEGQGFHTLLGDQARQATATGDDQQSAIDTLAEKELIQLHNNLQNQLDAINAQKANINTEKGQQIAAEREKLQTALAQTNNQLSIAQAKLAQGAERIDLSRQGLAQRINQNTFSDQLALQKLAKAGGSAKQNTTKLGNAEATLTQLMPSTDEAGAAFNWLTSGKTAAGKNLLNLLLTNGSGAIDSNKDLQPEANALTSKFGGDPGQTLQALQLALLALGGYGRTG